MTPPNRNKRLAQITVAALLVGAAAVLVFTALGRNLSYFYTPTDVIAAPAPVETNIRLGGLVEAGSVETGENLKTSFVVTDGAERINVTFTGILPDLFREGQGVIAQGQLSTDGTFKAETILAKHDENYVPKELKGIVPEEPAAQ